jgi:hypothetical protein
VNEKLGFPVFSGAGLSIDELRTECNSGVTKIDGSVTFFSDFRPLTVEAVKTYIRDFLDLQAVSEKGLDHIAKSLCGLPLWAATFLEQYLVREWKVQHIGTFFLKIRKQN